MILDTRRSELPPLELPATYNYLAAFLTLSCNLRCSYCINHFDAALRRRQAMSGPDWVRALNRIESRPDLPVTLQGGEPSLHPDFCAIINGLRPDLNIDILTNLQFDVDAFMRHVKPERVKRDAPYASIRVSYHPETMDLRAVKRKTLRLLANGYSVGIWAVRHPSTVDEIDRAQRECVEAGIDFRVKEFLGYHEGQLYGTYKFPGALACRQGERVECRTTELLIGPAGNVYRCHSDLYADRTPIGRLDDPAFVVEDVYRPCIHYGLCNPCDVKTKTNRFQQYGHTSVDIRLPAPEPLEQPAG
ncbi:MAG: radical SAM protein [Kiritimatiellae bacterium]|nr:radical SAM protein [Kiritimatiellia bacterium]